MCATFRCENCGRLGCVNHHRCESIERAGCDLRDELPREFGAVSGWTAPDGTYEERA